jgi:hypothetical protein
MIDFTIEHVIDIESLAIRLGVHQVTIRRWFSRGLEHAKLGGKLFTSPEAVQRFSRQSNNAVSVRAVVPDRETRAAPKSLTSQGIIFGSEAVAPRKLGARTRRGTAVTPYRHDDCH